MSDDSILAASEEQARLFISTQPPKTQSLSNSDRRALIFDLNTRFCQKIDRLFNERGSAGVMADGSTAGLPSGQWCTSSDGR